MYNTEDSTMFGLSSFVVKTILIWSIISVVLVESGRQERDVHHMIILKDDATHLKSLRHRHHIHNRGRSKRKPPKKNRYEHSSSSEESLEDNSYSYESSEEYRPHEFKSESREHNHIHGPKSQKHHKIHRNNKDQRHKHHHSVKDNRIPPESRPFPNGKWISISSHELLENAHHHTPPEFPATYQSGALYFQQPVPMELTTAHPLLQKAFVRYESTSYPPLKSAFNNVNPQIHQTLSQSPLSSVDTYKPFDYSVLEQQNMLPIVYPSQGAINIDSGVPSVQPTLAGTAPGTTFSIVLDNSVEKKVEGIQKENNEGMGTNNNHNTKENKIQGRNRFRIRKKV